jgi:hypothetical protein
MDHKILCSLKHKDTYRKAETANRCKRNMRSKSINFANHHTVTQLWDSKTAKLLLTYSVKTNS